ncbi:MAG: chemotaxis protein CheA [Spirochaetaceae bacterium]|nr:MAG: chemotaxis protein CheA [Spirochaetaceae bacterium]
MDKFQESFREEAYELLNDLERILLILEDQPESQEDIAAVFRVMHTVKGSAGMFGFTEVARFAHEVESTLDAVRNGRIPVTPQLVSLTLEARDHIREMLDEPASAGVKFTAVSDELIERFRAHVAPATEPAGLGIQEPETSLQELTGEEENGSSQNDAPNKDVSQAKTASDADEMLGETKEHAHPVTYRIAFKPGESILLNGTNPVLLLDELAEMGELSAIAYTEAIPPLSRLEPENCFVAWDLLLTTKKGRTAVRDVFMFVEDDSELTVEIIDEPEGDEHDHEYRRLGQILVDRGFVEAGKVESIAVRQQRLGEMLVEGGVDPRRIEAALAEQEHVERSRKKLQNELSSASVRVSSEKLDDLVDLVGELVTLQARLMQTAVHVGHSGLTLVSESFDRLATELRDNTMSLRMVPIGTTFSKFKRLVRDLSHELGKQVEIKTIGAETELDKSVIDRLNDPLVHLIRNSMDHGIEKPADRAAAAKPIEAQILLKAEHSGATVVVTVEDDGAGLNRERIRARAEQRGIITPGQELTNTDIDELLFSPGFSTSENVTSVSGRGVGMDVVRREIEGLGGTVAIHSTPGKGTSIQLVIPLTLAIIEGLLVQVGEAMYVFPLSSVGECIELNHQDRLNNGKRHFVANRGEVLPYVVLRDVFSVSGNEPDIEQIVVVSAQGEDIGFVVDEVIGDHQTVIKNLGRLYRHIEGISGATILGDGSVALILDVQKLCSLAKREHHVSH